MNINKQHNGERTASKTNSISIQKIPQSSFNNNKHSKEKVDVDKELYKPVKNIKKHNCGTTNNKLTTSIKRTVKVSTPSYDN